MKMGWKFGLVAAALIGGAAFSAAPVAHAEEVKAVAVQAETDKGVSATTNWMKKDVNGDGTKEWVYVMKNGQLKKGWVKDGGKWYFLDRETGAMQTRFIEDGGKGYYLGVDGAMRTGWCFDGYDWYYAGKDGALQKGWLEYKGQWYYLGETEPKGDYEAHRFAAHRKYHMLRSQYQKGYWLDKNGAWSYKPKASWKKDSKGWWFGDNTGWYVKGTSLRIDNATYVFDAKGYLVEK